MKVGEYYEGELRLDMSGKGVSRNVYLFYYIVFVECTEATSFTFLKPKFGRKSLLVLLECMSHVL